MQLLGFLKNVVTFTLSCFPSNRPLGGGEGTSYDGLCGEAPLEKGIFFSLQVYERVEISLAEVIKGVGKSAIWVFNRAQKG